MLLIEGAGGLFVPLNHQDCMINLIKHLSVPVILVSQIYLGSINHTLLSIHALKNRNIPIHGVLFNGKENKATQAVIENMSGVHILGRIEQLKEISSESIQRASQPFRNIYPSF